MRPHDRTLLALVAAAALSVCGSGCSDADSADPLDEAPSINPLPDGPLTPDEAFPGLDPPPVDDPFSLSVCQGRCVCSDADPADCADACLADLLAGAVTVAQLACEAALSCDERDRCTDSDATPPAACTDLCSAIADCAGFPSGDFGGDESTCLEVCGGPASLGDPDVNAALSCLTASWGDQCALGGVGHCQSGSLGPDDTCREVCERAIACESIPGEQFLTGAACVASCRELSALDQLQLDVCVGFAGCGREARCYPPTIETPAGCDPFCVSWPAACPTAGIGGAVCESICRGISQAAPGVALEGGASCIDALDACPTNPELLACLVPESPRCSEMCDALAACGVDRAECDAFCSLLSVLEPDRFDTMVDCVTEGTCASVGACVE